MTGGLVPYTAYRPSSVEWLGDVPTHWNVRRLRHSTIDCINGVWGADPDGIDDLPCVRVADFDRHRLRVRKPIPTLRAIAAGERRRRMLQPGDLLLEKSGGGDKQPVGVVMLFDHETRAVCTNFIARMTVREGFDSTFLTFLHSALYSIRLNARSIKQTTGIQNLDSAGYLGESAAFPPLAEQAAIVRYLDHVDRRIRRYVSAKRRLIALLEEEKHAVINQAVTRGLDPNVRLEPSGVEWLGDMPAHWEITRVKSEFLSLNRRRVPLSAVERGVMSVRKYDYYGASGVIDKVDDFLFDDELLLIAEDGANLVLRNLPLAIIARGRFWVNNHAHILKPRRGNLEYLAAVMERLNYTPWISGAAQPKLTQDRLMNISIAVPPRNEQDEIIASANAETSGLTAAIARSRRQIELVEEYRTRLIADVVTGKLDVREAAARLPDEPGDADRTEADGAAEDVAGELARADAV